METLKQIVKGTANLECVYGGGVAQYIITSENNKKYLLEIDLSNKRGKFDEDEIDRLSYEQYLLYKMVEGKNDLVYGLIKTICNACSNSDNSEYTTTVDGIFEEWNNDSARAAFGSL